MDDKNITCQNCELEFNESFEFCPHCGQKAKDKLTIGVLFYNTISNYFSFDARFFRSFFPLMFRPGYLAKKFVEGKRLRYLHPAQYYLFASVIFFFIFSFQAREYTQKADMALKKGFENDTVLKFDSIPQNTLDSISEERIIKNLKDKQIITGMDDEEIEKLDSIIKNSNNNDNNWNLNFDYDKEKLDSLIKVNAPEKEMLRAMGMKDDAGFFTRRLYSQMLKFQKNSGGGILQALFDSIPIALFILLPIFAFILKLFFWRRGSFAHHLVFSFYYFSFLFVLFGITLLANYFLEVPSWVNGIIALAIYMYLIIAIKKFYGQGYFLSFLKTGFVTFIYFSIVLPIALGIMTVASFYFY